MMAGVLLLYRQANLDVDIGFIGYIKPQFAMRPSVVITLSPEVRRLTDHLSVIDHSRKYNHGHQTRPHCRRFKNRSVSSEKNAARIRLGDRRRRFSGNRIESLDLPL